MAIIDIKVPDIGDFKDVAVIEVLVKPGDAIKAEQSLITVESDKASMEIPSSHAGVVKALKVKVGDTVQRGLGDPDAGDGSRRRRQRPPRRRLPRHRARRRGLAGARSRQATPVAPTSSATCSCSAPAPVATRPPSAPPTSA